MLPRAQGAKMLQATNKPTSKPAIAKVAVPATPSTPSMASLPTPAAFALAKGSAAQASLCLASFGNTLPPPSTVLAIGSGVAHGKANGQRNQHQATLLQAINAVLQVGQVATLANLTAWVRANSAALPAPHGAACVVPSNVRCALQQGTVKATGWGM